MTLQALLLDFDETLADTTAGRVASVQHAAARHLGRTLSDAEARAVLLTSSNLEAQMANLAGDAAVATRMVRAFREHLYGPDGLPPPLFPGVREALEALRAAGVTLAIVTSRTGYQQLDGLTWGILPDLDGLGLRDFFDAVVGFEDTTDHKPHPAPFLECLARLGLPPEQALAVGDSPHDIRAARAAGAWTAGALWGALDATALMNEKPDQLLARPADLLSVRALF